MLESLLKLAPNLLEFAKATKKNSEDIKKTNARLDALFDVVSDIEKRVSLMETVNPKDREILILQLKNILLEHGVTPSSIYGLNKQLPPHRND